MLRILVLALGVLGQNAMAETSSSLINSAPICGPTVNSLFSIEAISTIQIAGVSCNSDADCPGNLQCIGLTCRTP